METLQAIHNIPIQTCLIFKHSNTCSVSKRAYDIIKEAVDNGSLRIPVYLLVVQEQRELSNEIAQTTGIRHESPQVIFFKNSEAISHCSHFKIDVKNIVREIAKIL